MPRTARHYKDKMVFAVKHKYALWFFNVTIGLYQVMQGKENYGIWSLL
jgi:hypothetical protein